MVKKTNRKKKLAMAAAGLAIGAAAGAAAYVLSDKKKRLKIKKSLGDLKELGKKELVEVRSKLASAKKKSTAKLKSELKKVSKKL